MADDFEPSGTKDQDDISFSNAPEGQSRLAKPTANKRDWVDWLCAVSTIAGGVSLVFILVATVWPTAPLTLRDKFTEKYWVRLTNCSGIPWFEVPHPQYRKFVDHGLLDIGSIASKKEYLQVPTGRYKVDVLMRLYETQKQNKAVHIASPDTLFHLMDIDEVPCSGTGYEGLTKIIGNGVAYLK